MRSCPLCKSEANVTPLWGTEVLRCGSCRLGFVSNPPDAATQEENYSADYYVGDRGYADYEKEKVALQSNFKRRVDDLRRHSVGGQLLEIGCAYGFFLELAKQYWTVTGIDVSQAAVSYARDHLHLQAFRSGVEDFPLTSSAYDVVAMWDAIEHFRDPFLAVEKIAHALKPGGLLALTTGNLDAWLARLQRTRWRLFHPLHLYYFTPASIRQLLAKYDLEVLHLSHEGNDRSLRQMAQALGEGFARRVERMPFANVCFRINLFDIMFVLARKRGGA